MFYRFVRSLLWVVFVILFRFRREGQGHIPNEGPVIIASNHVSYLDPLIVAVASPRPVSFMAKAVFFGKPVLGIVMRMLNAFPVRKVGADLEAVKQALRVLRQGQVLGIFPEGTRQRSGVLGKAEPGVAHLAIKTGAPVVPVAVRGTFRPFPGKSIKALIGKPIVPPSGDNPRDSADRFAEEIMEAVSRLLAGKRT